MYQDTHHIGLTTEMSNSNTHTQKHTVVQNRSISFIHTCSHKSCRKCFILTVEFIAKYFIRCVFSCQLEEFGTSQFRVWLRSHKLIIIITNSLIHFFFSPVFVAKIHLCQFNSSPFLPSSLHLCPPLSIFSDCQHYFPLLLFSSSLSL